MLVRVSGSVGRVAVARAGVAAGLSCLLALFVMAILSAAVASAGSYQVVSCSGSYGNASWQSGNNTSSIGTGNHCPTDNFGWDGLLTHTQVQSGSTSNGQLAAWMFNAPSGTQITQASYKMLGNEPTDKYTAGMLANHGGGSTLLSGSWANDGQQYNTFGSWPSWNVSPPAGTYQLSAAVICQSGSCPLDNNSILSYVSIRDITVTVDDFTKPSIGGDQGSLATAAWKKGSGDIVFQSSDASGIKWAKLKIDGTAVGINDRSASCNYTLVSPCSTGTQSDGFNVGTAAFTDGPHTATYEVADTGGNVETKSRTLYWDNTAPLPPTGVSVTGGEDWRSQNGFQVSWDNPSQGQAAPIAKVHYKLCKLDGSCQAGAVNGAATSNTFNVPSNGQHTLQLWLEDAAGNVNSAVASTPVTLRYDPVPPGQAAPEKRNGWIGIAEAKTFNQDITLAYGVDPPVSGIKGYSVTTDGSNPDGTVEALGEEASYPMILKEGVTVIKARSVSNANLASNDVGVTELKVDLQRPSVSVTPDPGSEWRNEPVTVDIKGTDQSGLSGMAPSLSSQKIEEGAYVSYRLDGGSEQKVRGGEAEITVGEDGYHTLVVKAVDFAGNESAEQTVKFKVDRTAPDPVVFERVNPKDPRSVGVAVSDALSGVVSGRVEFRPFGSSAKWQPLETRLEGGRLKATFLDDGLPDGLYELRAVVTDAAGNVRISSDSDDGLSAVRTSPARDIVHLRSAIVAKLQKKCRKVRSKKRGRKAKRRCKIQRRTGSTVLKVQERSVVLAGKGEQLLSSKTDKKALQVKGVLLDSQGEPIGETAVQVHRLLTAKGTGWEQIGQVRTDSGGRFAYRYNGPSATVRFVYGGSLWRNTAQAEVKVRVPARTTLKTSKRFLYNGQKLKFTGKLLGKPLAGRGKLVELQAIVRGKWRTFATTRTDGNGRWRYTYRFQATRGLVKYTFRVRVRPEDSYPYVLGYSKVSKVTVKGPAL